MHTKEPWTTNGHSIGVAAGTIATIYAPGDRTGWGIVSDEYDANARRIVACVNACAGIKDPEAAIPKMVEALRSCLEFLDPPDPTPIRPGSELHRQIATALAALEDKP